MSNTPNILLDNSQEQQWREEAEDLFQLYPIDKMNFSKEEVTELQRIAYIAGRKSSLFDKRKVAEEAWDAAERYDGGSSTEAFPMGDNKTVVPNREEYLNNLK